MGTGGMTTPPAGSSQQGARDDDRNETMDATEIDDRNDATENLHNVNYFVKLFIVIFCILRETQEGMRTAQGLA